MIRRWKGFVYWDMLTGKFLPIAPSVYHGDDYDLPPHIFSATLIF